MTVNWTTEATAAAALRANGVETDLTDAALFIYAKSAVQEITARGYGPHAALDFVAYGSGSLLALPVAAAAVSAIIEEGTALTAATHYRLRPGGLFLERIYNGYPSVWYGRTTGTITATVADDRYDRVVTDLVKLALQYSGLDARRDGDYSEEAIGARGGGQKSYQDERDILISELAPPDPVFS